MKEHCRSHAFAILALAGLFHTVSLNVSPAGATGLSWNNPAGGSAATAANWTPAQIPGAADILSFNLTNTYTTTFTSATTTSTKMSLSEGNVTLNFTAPHTISQTFYVADAAGDTVRTTITGGTVSCVLGAAVGVNFGTHKATLRVRNADAIFRVTGAGADLGIGAGGSGACSLRVDTGGTVEVSDDVIVGADSVGGGYLNVSGRSISPTVPSSLTTTGATSDIRVGSIGFGIMTIDDFAIVNCGGSIQIAPTEHFGFGGNGTVTVGASTGGDATLNVDHDLNIGPSGDATLNILNHGAVNVTGTTTLGSTSSGNTDALLHIEGGLTGGHLTTGSLYLDNRAVLDFVGGLVTVDGGTLDTDGRTFIINAPGNFLNGPTIELTNGATASIPDSALFSVKAGTDEYGGIRSIDGAAWTLSNKLILGESAGGQGRLQVNTAGSVTIGGSLDAGVGGAASVEVATGGRIEASSVTTRAAFIGSATMSIRDAGSVVSALNSVSLGATTGSGLVSISNSGRLEVINGFTSTVGLSGHLFVQSSGVFTTPGDLLILGEVSLTAPAFLSADTVFVNSSAGKLNGTGTVTGKVSNAGTVSPGASAGKLAVTGTYAQTSTGILTIELGNHATSEWDTLAVSGAAILAGTLDIRTLPSFAAGSGDVFRIMTFASRTGTFPTVTLNGGPLTGLTVDYNSTNVTLKTTGATGVEPVTALPGETVLTGRSVGSQAEFELALPADAHVVLAVYDAGGRVIARLQDGEVATGQHRYVFGDATTRVPSGVYFGRAVVMGRDGTEVRTARVAIVR